MGASPAARQNGRMATHVIQSRLLIAALLAGCGAASMESPASLQSALPVVSTLAEGVIQLPRPEVDQYMQAQLVEQRIPGVALVVIKDGQIIFAKGYGYTSLAPARPVRPEDRFRIGPLATGALQPSAMDMARRDAAQHGARYRQHQLTVMAFTNQDAGRADPLRIVRAVRQMFDPVR